MQIQYAHEKLSATVSALAEGRGRIKERLEDAWSSQGMHTPVIDGGTYDPALADDIKQLGERLTRLRDSELGSVAATVQAMSEDEASGIAAQIVDLMHRVESLWQERRNPGSQ